MTLRVLSARSDLSFAAGAQGDRALSALPAPVRGTFPRCPRRCPRRRRSPPHLPPPLRCQRRQCGLVTARSSPPTFPAPASARVTDRHSLAHDRDGPCHARCGLRPPSPRWRGETPTGCHASNTPHPLPAPALTCQHLPANRSRLVSLTGIAPPPAHPRPIPLPRPPERSVRPAPTNRVPKLATRDAGHGPGDARAYLHARALHTHACSTADGRRTADGTAESGGTDGREAQGERESRGGAAARRRILIPARVILAPARPPRPTDPSAPPSSMSASSTSKNPSPDRPAVLH